MNITGVTYVATSNAALLRLLPRARIATDHYSCCEIRGVARHPCVRSERVLGLQTKGPDGAKRPGASPARCTSPHTYSP